MPPTVEEILADLIAFDTTSHRSNLPLLDYVSGLLDGLGADIQRQSSPAEPKANLVIRLGPDPVDCEGRGLVLCGHSDVVPALEKGWASDPFEMEEREGRLYGRGTADMKGFIALALHQLLKQQGESLTSPLVLVLTYDEEIGTLGARHFAEEWLPHHSLPKAVLIGEPTELKVIRLHKGHLKFRITHLGEGAHSAYPHLGKNAIEPIGDLIVALRALRIALEEMRVEASRHFAEVPYPTLNVAQIEGGTAVNIVPDRAHVDVGIRLLPGMDSHHCLEQVRQLAGSILPNDRWSLDVLSDSPPAEAAADNRLHHFLQNLVGQKNSRSVAFATDAGWLNQAGLECSIFGPGSIRVAHKPNEFIERSQLEEAEGYLDRCVEEFCQ